MTLQWNIVGWNFEDFYPRVKQFTQRERDARRVVALSTMRSRNNDFDPNVSLASGDQCLNTGVVWHKIRIGYEDLLLCGSDGHEEHESNATASFSR